MLSGAQLVLVVHHIGTREGVVAETLTHGAREIQLLKLEVAGKEGVDYLIGGVIGVGNGELGLGLLFQKFVVGNAGNSGHAAQNGTENIFKCFHNILCN